MEPVIPLQRPDLRDFTEKAPDDWRNEERQSLFENKERKLVFKDEFPLKAGETGGKVRNYQTCELHTCPTLYMEVKDQEEHFPPKT